MWNRRSDCYCAFCRSPRKIYSRRRSGPLHWTLSAVAAISLMFLIWHEWDPQGLYFLGFFLLASEFFLQTRWRLSVVCRDCGFDPILYTRDSKAAVEKVKAHMDARKNDPSQLLKSPLDLPTITPRRADLIQKAESGQRGSLVSKQI